MTTTSTRRQNASKLYAYYYLIKPGIVYSNTLAAMAGYLFGAGGAGNWSVFAALTLGVGLIISSACVYNNILDRDIDAEMQRTQKRAIVQGAVSPWQAFIFGSLLLIGGVSLLYLGTNLLAILFAVGGHLAYALLYTYTKRLTVHGTLIGTISGSTPPVIGYVAATGQVDLTALLLYLILVSWQMPHFYAIALFRRTDYAKARIPVLSVVKGEEATRRQIIAYVLLFVVFCLMIGYTATSLFTTLVLTLCGIYWLYLCLMPPIAENGMISWARRQFGWSLIVLLVLCISLSVDSFFH